MKNYLACLIAVGLLFSQETWSWADTPDFMEFYQKENKVVTASKKEESINEAPGVIEVITSDEIRRFGAQTLRDVLDRATSVYTLSSYLFPQNVVSIRGDLGSHTNNHVLFLLNGRPTRESAFGGEDIPILLAFPVETIERVEIIRGPGSVLYGTNAYSGVINVITKTADNKEGQVQAGYGSHNSYKYAASGGVKTDKVSVYGGALQSKSDGWPFQAVDEKRVLSSMHYSQTTDGGILTGAMDGFTINGFFGDTNQEHIGGTSPVWPQQALPAKRTFFDAGYKHDLTDKWDASFNVTYNDNDLVAPIPGISPDRSSQDVLGELTVRGKPLDDLNVLFGGTTERDSGEFTPENIDYHSTMASSYMQADYRLFRFLKLVAGGQWNKPENSKSDLLPRVGLIANFNSGWGSKLLYSQAYRSTAAQETDFQASSLVGNPALKPEKVATTDAQVFYQTPKYQVSTTYFYSKQTDRITRIQTANPAVFTFINSGQLQSHGVELESKLYPLPLLSLIMSYTYQTNENQADQSDVTFMPTHMAKAGVSYDWRQGVTTSLFDSYFSERQDVNILTPTTLEVNPPAGAYHWMTANVIFDMTKLLKLRQKPKLSLKLYAENLLNESVYDPEFNRRVINTLPARPGRTFMSEVVVNF